MKYIYPDNVAKIALESVGVIGLAALIDSIDSFRFFYTYNVIKSILKKDETIDTEIKNKLLALQNNIEVFGKEKQKVIRKKYLLPNLEIKNWS